MEKPDEEIAKPDFKETYGILIENISVEQPHHKRIYYPIYLSRRFFYMCTIVLFSSHALLQISFIILTTILVHLPTHS